MRRSIFEIENRLDIKKEFEKFSNCLLEQSTISYNYNLMSFYRFINVYAFNLWEYRDTFIDFGSYLEHIGITNSILHGTKDITEDIFLNFLELMLNLMMVVKKNFINKSLRFDIKSTKVANIIEHNIPIILEKMNYEVEYKNNMALIKKRDEDVDSVLDLVPEGIQVLLLEYNDIRNNTISDKMTILKKIDLYIEERAKFYKGLNAATYESIQLIVNKMGVNHPLKDSPYVDMSEAEIIEWYDRCFKLMIHLIRTEDVNNINNERKELVA